MTCSSANSPDFHPPQWLPHLGHRGWLRISDDLFDLRLMVEELVCNIYRFAHVAQDKMAPEDICIWQEVPLAHENADIHVSVPGARSYFIEVKLVYSGERLMESVRRKFTTPCPCFESAEKLILMIVAPGGDWPDLQSEIIRLLRGHWTLELWDVVTLLEKFGEYFGNRPAGLALDRLHDLRTVIEQTKARHAFGMDATPDHLEATFLWQCSLAVARPVRQGGEQEGEHLGIRQFSVRGCRLHRPPAALSAKSDTAGVAAIHRLVDGGRPRRLRQPRHVPAGVVFGPAEDRPRRRRSWAAQGFGGVRIIRKRFA